MSGKSMTFEEILQAIPSWVVSVVTTILNAEKDQAATVAVKSGSQPLTTLALIEQERGSFGPSPRTGGVAHRVTDEQAALVAQLIDANASATLTRATICAWLRGESAFDPLCVNPNRQDARAGETPEQAFLHTDIGIGQFDGAGLLEMLPGLTWDQAQAKALDPTWAIPQFVRMAEGLLAWAQAHDALLREAPYGVVPPYGASRVLGFEAYNTGRTGALVRVLNASGDARSKFAIASHGGELIPIVAATADDLAFTAAERQKITDAAFGYGSALETRRAHYALLLGVPA